VRPIIAFLLLFWLVLALLPARFMIVFVLCRCVGVAQSELATIDCSQRNELNQKTPCVLVDGHVVISVPAVFVLFFQLRLPAVLIVSALLRV
jgi:hypothetical protein